MSHKITFATCPEAAGLSRLYADAALRAVDEGSGSIDFAAAKLELGVGRESKNVRQTHRD